MILDVYDELCLSQSVEKPFTTQPTFNGKNGEKKERKKPLGNFLTQRILGCGHYKEIKIIKLIYSSILTRGENVTEHMLFGDLLCRRKQIIHHQTTTLNFYFLGVPCLPCLLWDLSSIYMILLSSCNTHCSMVGMFGIWTYLM